jgi:prolyl oligopeptidase
VVYPERKRRFLLPSYENQKEASFLQNDEHKLYFHKLNVSKEDGNLWRRPKRRYIGGYVTEDDAYLVSAANSTYGNELYKI